MDSSNAHSNRGYLKKRESQENGNETVEDAGQEVNHSTGMSPEFADAVSEIVTDLFPRQPHRSGRYLAPLLWQRGWRDLDTLPGLLHPDHYTPTSAFAFGAEMEWAVARLQQAHERQEKVAIWGDFDADGLTATAVLWDGLGQFFPKHTHLDYVVPNRLTQSHGLNRAGLAQLAAQDCTLIVTCDTGSTNLEELEYARTLGLDVIVTDHHTLAPDRPDVVALINPRTLPPGHSLSHLSGVAVAYKLVEALYETLPQVPQQPLDRLLDLVAIGLITDLVELKGDCRYLAQRGIQQLQTLLKQSPPTRPGIARLLQLCRRTGDRPTDISFGIGPRINAISRIHGDASFAIELLTSQDGDRCHKLAEETELANSRRKALQRDVMQQALARLAELDLSTTQVIVLADPQWSVGVLGLVAGQLAQEFNRPAILLTTPPVNPSSEPDRLVPAVTGDAGQDIHDPTAIASSLAKGSARSAQNINLYDLVQGQSHLLHRFGGHPFAAGLSLPVENIPVFRDAINRRCRAQYGDLTRASGAIATADLTVTVAELGQGLFRELKLLEPCGMGNPVPRLRVQQCEFKGRSHRNIKDFKGGKLRYIKTDFLICDTSHPQGFPGVWWGHYQDELPDGPCDAIVELDFNSYVSGGRYEVRLLELLPASVPTSPALKSQPLPSLLDWRPQVESDPSLASTPDSVIALKHCPHNWTELEQWVHHSLAMDQPLAIAFSLPSPSPPDAIWRHLVGIAKYLSRTATTIEKTELAESLGIGDRPLTLGLLALTAVGFMLTETDTTLSLTISSAASESLAHSVETSLEPPTSRPATPLTAIKRFFTAIQEEQFQQQYFAQVSVDVLEEALVSPVED